MRPLTKKARSVVNQLIEAFDAPEKLIDTIAKATLIPNNSPCVKWGLYNRFIVALRGTSDARGFRQWQEVGRKVKKGAKAILILVPRFKKIESEEDGEDEKRLIGFVAAPVFAFEDTQGEPLPEYEPPQLPKLQSVADSLNLPVKYTGAVSDEVLGVYSHEPNDEQGNSGKITLYSLNMSVFYHELSHALHHRSGKLRPTNKKENKRANEIVAEIAATVLVNIFEGQEMGRQAICYIKGYDAKKKHLFKLLPEIMEVINLAIDYSSYKQKTGKGIANS